MEFSEAHTAWRTIPEWGSFLIRLGFSWPEQPSPLRRIAVVSMPCDSSGAGLIALGAMRKYLELADAHDANIYHARLIALAKSTGAQPVTLRHIKRPGVFKFKGVGPDGVPWVRQVKSKSEFSLSVPRSSALDWQIVGEPLMVLPKGEELPHASLYDSLVPEAGSIERHNLSESNSQVCLAGRVSGGDVARRVLEETRFRQHGVEADLSQLLAIHEWMPKTVSRVVFFNSRTGTFDRPPGRPQVVVADGDKAFLRVVDHDCVAHSDVIGVVQRAQERDGLEGLGNYLQQLQQWYEPVALDGLPQPPRGIGVAVLHRRRQCE